MTSQVRQERVAPANAGRQSEPGRLPRRARLSANPGVSKALAAVVIAVIAMRIELPQQLTVGYVAAAMLVPLWFPVLRRYWGARSLLALGLLALVSGIWLTELAKSTHATSLGQTISISIGLVGLLCAVAFVLWARTVLPDAKVALFYGVGLFFGAPTTGSQLLLNPWRFGFAAAVTVTLLAIALQTGRRWVELVAALALTVVSAFTDARSSFAILLLTAILIAWQMRPARPGRGKSALRVILALITLAVVVYNVGQALILDGYLGEATQQRSLAQIDTSGSLILGGRPELAATLSLIQHRPWGYGSGTAPNLDDILAAKTGMATLNYQPNNGYVERYMFGGHIELHSMFGDLWASFGIPGLILAGFLLVLVLRGIGRSVASGTASAILIFLGVTALWTLFFAPLHSSTELFILGLGLMMVRQPGARPEPGGRSRR
jgi:hypothetical protein